MQESGSGRRLSLVASTAPGGVRDAVDAELAEPGLADVVLLQRRAAALVTAEDEQGFYQDTMAEYLWARDVAGLAPTTLQGHLKPVIELCSFYELMPWRLTPRHLDQYFAGQGKRAHSTIRSKLNKIDSYFRFLEQRYAGEIARRFGVAVESPVDPFNQPAHRGDFGLRIPPSRAAMTTFFTNWRTELPQTRKYAVACRDYVMAKLAYISGVRATELCAVRLGDLHWELGQWGRFIVRGKGAHGSGPRERQAYLFREGRELVWWYIEDIRGEFSDDAADPGAPLFPSERLPAAISALNVAVAPAVTPDTFRKSLKAAATRHLPGPVTNLFPHLLRHACATHLYEGGMALWDVQQVLGHVWPTTTVNYVSSVRADPELASATSARRAVRRLSKEG